MAKVQECIGSIYKMELLLMGHSGSEYPLIWGWEHSHSSNVVFSVRL